MQLEGGEVWDGDDDSNLKILNLDLNFIEEEKKYCLFTSWKAMSVDEPGIQGLVGLGQEIVQMVGAGAPRDPTRQAQEGRQGGGEGGGDRWSVVSMEGGRQHGMEARREAR